MELSSRIYVAGHRGLAGSAIVRRLRADGYKQLILRTRAEVDLLDARAVYDLFRFEQPEYVFLAAAKVGGILANQTYPADFLRENLSIELNVFEAARRSSVKKVQFLGSSCIYPKMAPQPIKEEYLLTGLLEPTNEPYAIAKIAGIKLAQAYRQQHGMSAISLMPTNLYGPGDNFDLQSAHVLPALIRKVHEAKLTTNREVVVWGTGSPRREFLHIDDLASAAVYLMQKYDDPLPVNVGVGEDVTIADLVDLVCSVVGYHGKVVFDPTKPDGAPRKLLDVSRLTALGWKPEIPLRQGIEETYKWYLGNAGSIRMSAVRA